MTEHEDIEALVRKIIGIPATEELERGELAEIALDYARDKGLSRFIEAEPLFLQWSNDAFLYSRDVLKHRWPACETLLAASAAISIPDLHLAFDYARDVIQDSWPEMEPLFASDPYYATIYPAFLRWVDDGNRGVFSLFVEPDREDYLAMMAVLK